MIQWVGDSARGPEIVRPLWTWKRKTPVSDCSMAVPSEWSESQPQYRRHAPRLGEHTREVLREAGLSEQDIQTLVANGAARAAD